MSHKQKCIDYAQERLLAIGCAEYWSDSHFMSWYRKHDKGNGNAYITGLSAADYILNETLNNSKNDNRHATQKAIFKGFV